MVSYIKNEIIKYLSKYTKGLSIDKINFTFKGEGELRNIELDENNITGLLELPTWLKLTHAECNRVTFKVPWTKLKSVPIFLSLDEVKIYVETCEELKEVIDQGGHSSYAGAAKYTFIHRVIDGVTVEVKTVKIFFRSPTFTANVELSRIIAQSKSPIWNSCDLSQTRLKDSEQEQVLLFKELEWQSGKIEAFSTKDKNLTPLRLITNKTICRITLKKSLRDSSILGSRLALILEDLLWVLTDFQLKAALHFIDSLLGLIQKATEETRKKKAARKLETLPEYQAQQYQSKRNKPETSATNRQQFEFSKFDVVETSYHFLAEKIDLHLMDDLSAGRSCHPELVKGGAFRISFKFFRIDHYPYHLEIADRNHWPTYKNSSSPVVEWLQEAQLSFNKSLLDLIGDKTSRVRPRPTHNGTGQREEISSPTQETNSLKSNILSQMNKLMTSCTVIKVTDFSLSRDYSSSSKKHGSKDFISVDYPQNEPVVHAEFTYSYFPGDDPFPLPAPKFYVHLKPIQIHFDIISILWLKAFSLNLQQSLMQTSTGRDASGSNSMYFDVKIEAISPRVILESAIDHPGQKDRPKSLHIQSSRVTITNFRSNEKSSRSDLKKCLDSFNMCSLFFNRDFPSESNDFSIFHQKFLDHVEGSDNVRPVPEKLNLTSVEELNSQLRPDLLWTEARDVWSIELDPLSGDFYGTRAVGKDHPVPFLDSFPLTLWVYSNPEAASHGSKPKSGVERSADMYILAHITTLVSLQLNHYQYLFLLRLSEEAKELTTYLGIDANRILQTTIEEKIVLAAVVPQFEMTLVMPSQLPGKESSGGDVESVYPDTSSLQDEVTAQANWNSSGSFHNQPLANPAPEKKVSITELPVEINPCLEHSVIPVKAANGIPLLSTKALSIDAISFQAQNPFSFIKKKREKFMKSIDLTSKSSSDEISDTLSIKSDVSCDQVLVIRGETSCNILDTQPDGLESLFYTQSWAQMQLQRIEVASEMNEDTLTSPTSERDSFASYCRRDLVSLMTFKLGKMEVLKQTEGFVGAVKVQISSVGVEECSSIPWDEFQNKFRARTKDWGRVPLDAGVRPRIRLRMNHYLKPEFEDFQKISSTDRNTVLNWFGDNVSVRLQSISLDMNASTLCGLTDLIEDEIYPVPFPVTVNLEDIKLHIMEDRPPNNITSPGAAPVDVKILRLSVYRDASGVIQICPPNIEECDNRQKFDSCLSKDAKLLQLENEELRRRLSALEDLSEEYYRLKKQKQESEMEFRLKMEEAQADISNLLQNKSDLLDKVTLLNNLLQSERNSKR